MIERDTCPVCDKTVVGLAALAAHLEFSHQIADPVAFLAELDKPPRRRSRVRVLAPRVLVVVGMLVGFGALSAGAAALVGGSDDDQTLVAPAAPATTDAPTTSVTTPTTAAPPTTAVTTTVPPTTTTVTSTPPVQHVTTGGPFRKPFATASRVTGCTPGADVDTYDIEVTLSGARNVVVRGEFFPDRTGDGDRDIAHEAPAGERGFLDRMEVADAAGTTHQVELLPPLHLPGC